ncbi:MAG: hypothetical protein AMXMBFR82_07370 [Candidatus Hydrogenedentota bacterium]
MSKRLSVVCAALVLAVALGPRLVNASEKNDGSTLTKVGDPAPDFEFTTLDGVKITSESTKGKVVLLNFFATWCGPCRTELPHLATAYRDLKEDDGVVVLSVGREHSKKELMEFAKEEKLDLPFAPDPERKMYNKFATQWIPRNYVIGPDGVIAMQEIGFDEKEFRAMLDLVETLRAEIEASSEESSQS